MASELLEDEGITTGEVLQAQDVQWPVHEPQQDEQSRLGDEERHGVLGHLHSLRLLLSLRLFVLLVVLPRVDGLLFAPECSDHWDG